MLDLGSLGLVSQLYCCFATLSSSRLLAVASVSAMMFSSGMEVGAGTKFNPKVSMHSFFFLFCIQLTKAYMAETSCDQLLIDTVTYCSQSIHLHVSTIICAVQPCSSLVEVLWHKMIYMHGALIVLHRLNHRLSKIATSNTSDCCQPYILCYKTLLVLLEDVIVVIKFLALHCSSLARQNPPSFYRFAGYENVYWPSVNTLDCTKSVSASICLSFIDMRKAV